MKFTIKLLLLSIIFLGSYSCKKKDTTPAPTNNSSNTPVADGSPSNATQFNGIFTTGTYSSIASGTLPAYVVNSARVYFSSQPVSYVTYPTAVQVGKVYLNGDTLGYSSSYKEYINVLPVNLASETWSVNGANGIGTFTINVNPTTPSIGSAVNFPDSVSISSGFSLVVNNVSNTTKAQVVLYDGTSSANNTVSKTISNGNNSVSFSAAELSNLAITNNASLLVILNNNKAFVFSSKDYQFNREIQISKTIKIKS